MPECILIVTVAKLNDRGPWIKSILNYNKLILRNHDITKPNSALSATSTNSEAWFQFFTL
jgi:hypothetical protein